MKKKSVALLIETSNEYARGLLRGILNFQDEHERWKIDLDEHERGARPPEWFRKYQGDGIIARIETEEIAEAVRQTGLPAVDVSAGRKLPGIPWVETDDAQISQLVVEHFIDRGIHSVAFCGEMNFNWARWRCDAFLHHAQSRDLETFSFELPSLLADKNNRDVRDRLKSWLSELPNPCGILAAYDPLARRLLELCQEVGRSIPNSIAIVGVDNDPLLCRMASPPLSSVIPDAQGAGYQAAVFLDKMMSQNQVVEERILMPPIGIEVRRSSDTFSLEDPDVEIAARFILGHADEGIGVAEVVDQTALTRRALELRFRKLVGKTPHEFIIDVRMSKAQSLLRETSLTLQQIAMRCGIETGEYLSTVFKRHFHMTPGRYRQLHQSKVH